MKNTGLILKFALAMVPVFIQAQDKPAVEKCIPCEKLAELKLPDVRITEAKTVSAASSYCQVLGVIGTEIKFELLLPFEWKGIFIMGGGGGFVGTVQNLARSTVLNGYATSGTDTGHEGKSGNSADWALNNMERQVNFGHLAVHRTVAVSKTIIGNYYGSYPRYSYFIGCSRGGGQAMMEAQRYPEDFDGIVAGAPAFDWPAVAAEFVQNTQAVYPANLTEPLLTRDHLRILQEAILKQCDTLDGIRDKILSNPEKCKFDLNTLPKCPGDLPGKGCFTSAQINAVKTIYDGIDLGNGISYPGFPFGGENEMAGWSLWITGSGENTNKTGYPSFQAAFGIETFKYLILQDPDWNYANYKFKGYEKEIKYAAAYLDATSTDYSGFKSRKGKIILWHGWSDPALSAFATIEHFKSVKAVDPEVNDYMKLFLLPGILHCGGGEGPSGVDWISIIRDWVENGKAPEKVILSKTKGGKIVMTRPVFPYPGEAVYDGKGDPNTENSFITK